MVNDMDSFDISKIPKCRNYNINHLINLLTVLPPPEGEHPFILWMLVELKAEVESCYSGHSGSREDSLKHHMRFIEIILHPDLARDWKECNMNKNRQVLDAECSHSEQCQTNDHLISVLTKATEMYNDPILTLTTQVFADWGAPFDVAVTLHPVGEEHCMSLSKRSILIAMERWTRLEGISMRVVKGLDLILVPLRLMSNPKITSTHIWLSKMAK